MRQAHRFFNLLLPFKSYEELKILSIKTDRPIAELIRKGIDLVLKNKDSKYDGDGNYGE